MSGTWRPANAWRRWKEYIEARGVRFLYYFLRIIPAAEARALPRTYGVVSASKDKTLRSGDAALELPVTAKFRKLPPLGLRAAAAA